MRSRWIVNPEPHGLFGFTGEEALEVIELGFVFDDWADAMEREIAGMR